MPRGVVRRQASPVTEVEVRAPGAPVVGRPMVALLIVTFGFSAGVNLLMSVVPLYAVAGGAGDLGAGLSTGAMMLATVVLEAVMPGLLTRFGHRAALAAGLVLLGAPALALAASPALPLVLAASLARGAGLGITVVVGTALAAGLAPADRRGEALGLYGVAVGAPAVAALPLGVWLSQHVGFVPVLVAGAALPLAVLPVLAALPARAGAVERHAGVLGGLRDRGMVRQVVIFTAITMAAGVLMTFLPVSLPGRASGAVAVALLAQAAAAPVARWAAGRHSDRHRPAGLLPAAVLVAAVGMAGVAVPGGPVPMIAGAALFGAGFGAAQNLTLALMFRRAPDEEFGRVSALWNGAYDGGMGLGAVGFGALAGPAGYAAGFGATAAVLLAAVVPAWLTRRDARAEKGEPHA